PWFQPGIKANIFKERFQTAISKCFHLSLDSQSGPATDIVFGGLTASKREPEAPLLACPSIFPAKQKHHSG
ncbi:MAG TPA: hypothetical protein PKC98_14930, partial [Candidatus Melainabacteria bacterium]|nr:hypothetical protein [Candidatus Melainabacteria bacterium]